MKLQCDNDPSHQSYEWWAWESPLRGHVRLCTSCAAELETAGRKVRLDRGATGLAAHRREVAALDAKWRAMDPDSR